MISSGSTFGVNGLTTPSSDSLDASDVLVLDRVRRGAE